MNESLLFVIVGVILVLSVAMAFIATNAGVPALVVFLVFGMLLGVDGPGHIGFTNVDLARGIGTIGLVLILFDGGLSTSWRRLREAALPAFALSTVGVFITAILGGVAAHFLFNLPWSYAMLLGSVVSSTDAAAVFATLRFTSIRRRLARILEAESGLNDPMAVALTVGFIAWIQQPAYGFWDLGILLVEQLGIGLIVGLLLGRVATFMFSHMPHNIGSFSSVISIAAALLSFGVADLLGGSGFLAVYLVGLAIGSTPSRYRGSLSMFHEGLAFVAQVAMFIIMGLFIVPHRLWVLIVPGVVLTLILVVIIRPIAVWIATAAGKLTHRERAFIGWAGLRGAVPIVLATYVLSANISHSQMIFNIVFFVVLTSTILQGTTLDWAARYLNVIDKLPAEKFREYKDRVEKIFFHVAPRHSIARAMIKEVGLPPKARIISIRRRGKNIELAPDTIIRTGDTIVVAAPYSIHPEVEDVFMRWRQRI